MDGQVDTSIYGGLQTPQPANLLGMGMQAAYMANAMNQNRMFQLQMQARQGLAEVAQRHVNQDGTMDFEGFLPDLFQDKRTALLAPQIATQLYQSQLLNMQTLNAQWDLKNKQMGSMANSFGTLLPLGDRISQKDAINELTAQLGYGTYTPAETANLIYKLAQFPDQKDAQGNVIGNPALAQYIRTFASQFQQSRENFNNYTGTLQQLNAPGGGMQYGRFSPVTGGYTPLGGAAPVTEGAMGGQQGGGFTQYSPNGPTGQYPGVAPGQVQTQGGLAPPPGPNADPNAVDQAVLMLMHRESGQGNQFVRNVPTSAGPGDAFGYGQIQPATWKEGLQLAGMDPNLDIHHADFGQQFAVTKALYLKYGEQPWAASHGMSGPLPQGQTQPQGQTPEQMATATPGSATMAPNLSQSQFAGARQEQAALPGQLAQEPMPQGNTPAGPQPNTNQGGVVTPTPSQLAQVPPGMTTQQGASGQTQAPQSQYQPIPPGPRAGASYNIKNPPTWDEMLQGKGKYGDYETALKAQVDQDGNNNRVIGEMENALRLFQSGRGATAFMEAGRLANTIGQALGVPPDTLGKFVEGISRGDNNAMQEFMKLAAPQAIGQVRVVEGPNSKVTNMVAGTFLQTQPNLEMDPNAIHRMFNFAKKVQALNQEHYQQWIDWKQDAMKQMVDQQQAGYLPNYDGAIERLDQFEPKFQKAMRAEGYLNYNPVKDDPDFTWANPKGQ